MEEEGEVLIRDCDEMNGNGKWEYDFRKRKDEINKQSTKQSAKKKRMLDGNQIGRT